MKIGILGAGTWGIALARLLSGNGHDVTVWSAIASEIDLLKEKKEHPNLPGVILPEALNYTKDLKNVCAGKDLLVFAVPSAYVRTTTRSAAPYIEKGQIIVDVAKGIEHKTLFSMSEIIHDELSNHTPALDVKIVALSGPTHAEEVARDMLTSVVSACENEEYAKIVADAFMNSYLRVYTNPDIKGVELCGALKNIIALAAGMVRGMGYGDNTKAMLITRGNTEMVRIGLAMGCRRRTFTGLAGIGDLIVTCTSVHSRNNRCGELMGQGLSYEEAAKQIGMVVEGYYALDAAMELSEKYGVDMPIVSAVYDIVKIGRNPRIVVQELMTREMKSEMD